MVTISEEALAELRACQEALFVIRREPITIVLATACPLPSCGAKVGEACNRDPYKGGMGVHRVDMPVFHWPRIKAALK